MQVEGIKRTRGSPKMTRVEVLGKDVSAYDLMKDMPLDRVVWKNKFFVADPK